MNVDYSQYKNTDEKFLKKIYNLLGEENFTRIVKISNEYCVIDKYRDECDKTCSKCFVNFIKDKEVV